MLRRLVFVMLGVAAGVAAALYLSAQQQLADEGSATASQAPDGPGGLGEG